MSYQNTIKSGDVNYFTLKQRFYLRGIDMEKK